MAGKRGRPRLVNPRSHVVKVSLTAQELSKAKSRAILQGIPISLYVRQALLAYDNIGFGLR